MKKYNLQYLKKQLFKLVKMDYGFEIYNKTPELIRFSFYHLGSVYNAFCTTIYFKDAWTAPKIDWQYARPNEKAAQIAKNVLLCLIALKNDDRAEQEVLYYKNLSTMVFEAKYNISVELHTLNE